MDFEIRVNERKTLMGDRFAFRHKKRLQTQPKLRSQKQIFGEHIRSLGLAIRFTFLRDKLPENVFIGFSEDDMQHFSRFLWGQELSLPFLVAIFRVTRGANFIDPCCKEFCPNLALVAGATQDFCYECCLEADFLYENKKQKLREFYEQHMNDGYDHYGSGLLAKASYDDMVARENFPGMYRDEIYDYKL